MLTPGVAKKVTIHLNEDTSDGGGFLYEQIFTFLFERGVAGASMMRPHAGFGSHHRRHTLHGEWASGEHLPIRIEFVETEERVTALLPSLYELVTDGLIEAHDTVILKAAFGQQEDLS